MNKLSVFVYLLYVLIPAGVIAQKGVAGQSEKKRETINRIISSHNEDSIFTRLPETAAISIDENHRESFIREVAKLAEKVKSEAVQDFVRTYSSRDLELIDADLQNNDRYNQSEITIGFRIKWKAYKKKFYLAFRKIYDNYKRKTR